MLAGMGANGLWGWKIEGDRVRFFTLAMSKKGTSTPRFDNGLFPVPDRADRVGDRLLLVYSDSGTTRWEVWQNGIKLAARAYEDRIINAVALGPKEGWLVVGQTNNGLPWVNHSGTDEDAPVGWRGRLSVGVWFGEGANMVPMAAGWGTSGGLSQLLFWEPDGWTQPAPEPVKDAKGSQEPSQDAKTEVPAVPSEVYPVVGSVADKGLVLGGWAVSEGTTRAWFWAGKPLVGTATLDGAVQVLVLDKRTGIVVKHHAPPWFSLEDGKTSEILEGLEETDRVVAVQPAAKTN